MATKSKVQQLYYHQRNSDNAGKGQEPYTSVNPEQQMAMIIIFGPRTANPGEGLCFSLAGESLEGSETA